MHAQMYRACKNAVPENPPVTAEEKNKQLVSFEKNVERRMGPIDVKLAKLIREFDCHKNKFLELGQQLNNLNDALQNKFTSATDSILKSVDSNTRDVKALFKKKTESMMTSISSVFSNVVINPKTKRWTLTGYSDHKAHAIEQGWSRILTGEKVYMQRYLISWGILSEASGDHVSLHLSFQLHKGRNDEFIEWPFMNEVKLCVIHPETQEEHCASEQPSYTNVHFYTKPPASSNERFYFSSIKIDSNFIEKNGYNKADQLLFRLEVLS